MTNAVVHASIDSASAHPSNRPDPSCRHGRSHTPNIYVDPVVLALLRERTALGDSYNSTIRKHLGLPGAPDRAEVAAMPPGSLPPLLMTARPGALLPLIAAGKLVAGQALTWHRPRRGQMYLVPSTVLAGSSPPTASCSTRRTAARPRWPDIRARAGPTGKPQPARACSNCATRQSSRPNTTPHPTSRPPTRQPPDPIGIRLDPVRSPAPTVTRSRLDPLSIVRTCLDHPIGLREPINMIKLFESRSVAEQRPAATVPRVCGGGLREPNPRATNDELCGRTRVKTTTKPRQRLHDRDALFSAYREDRRLLCAGGYAVVHPDIDWVTRAAMPSFASAPGAPVGDRRVGRVTQPFIGQHPVSSSTRPG